MAYARYMNITMDVNPETTSNRYTLIPSSFDTEYMVHVVYLNAVDKYDYAMAWVTTKQLARIIFTEEEDGI